MKEKYLLAILVFISSLFYSVQSMDWATFKEMPVEIKLNIINKLVEEDSLENVINNLQSLRLVDTEFYDILTGEKVYSALLQLSSIAAKGTVFHILDFIKINPILLQLSGLADYIAKNVGYLPADIIQYGLNLLVPGQCDEFKKNFGQKTLNDVLFDYIIKSKINDPEDAFANPYIIYQTFALLLCGADPHAKNNQGNTALISAVAANNQVIVALLLDRGMDVKHPTVFSNTRGTRNLTPLETAIRAVSLDNVKLLLMYYADPNAKSSTNQPPLKLVIDLRSGGQDELKDFLALHIAEELLQFGAEPNADIKEGVPLIVYAAAQNDREMVSLLLAYGANVSPATLEKYKNKIVTSNLDDEQKENFQYGIEILEEMAERASSTD